ncbi:MAG: hypothetical protein ACXWZB_08860 [Gaiellaceae bacterium]
MKKSLIVLVAIVLGILGAVLAANPFYAAAAKPQKGTGEQADSVRFELKFTGQGDASLPGPDVVFRDVVYCGVADGSEPYVFDVAVSNPSALLVPDDFESGKSPSHEGAGWLSVVLQGKSPVDDGTDGERGIEFNVPTNDSFSFSLTLGGLADVDQIVQVTSHPLGDVDGGGAAFRGIATVRAQQGAVDPFDGDGVDDNYCVSIGPGGGLPGGEFPEGDLSTRLPVRDEWVLDGDGSDGGVLRGFPH